jgi:hypothetical protein
MASKRRMRVRQLTLSRLSILESKVSAPLHTVPHFDYMLMLSQPTMARIWLMEIWRKEGDIRPTVTNPEDLEMLWKLSEEVVGQKWEFRTPKA